MNYEGYAGRGALKTSLGTARPVTYLPNESEWVERIYQLECADPTYTADQILGGANGIANAQAQALSNRTNALKDKLGLVIDTLNALIDATQTTLSTVKALKVTKTAPTNWTNTAWLNIGKTLTEPQIVMEYIEGAHTVIQVAPTFHVFFADGTDVYIRTDGTALSIEHIRN